MPDAFYDRFSRNSSRAYGKHDACIKDGVHCNTAKFRGKLLSVRSSSVGACEEVYLV